MKTKRLSYKKLRQRCDDFEVLLLEYVRQQKVSSFEMNIFVRLFSDPITFRVEADDSDMRIYKALMRLNVVRDELERKHLRLQAGLI